MAISRAQLAKELEPGLNALFGLEYDRYENEHTEIFEEETSDRMNGDGPANDLRIVRALELEESLLFLSWEVTTLVTCCACPRIHDGPRMPLSYSPHSQENQYGMLIRLGERSRSRTMTAGCPGGSASAEKWVDIIHSTQTAK